MSDTRRVELTADAFQRQYGSLEQAAEKYYDGTMPEAHRWSFERNCPPHIIAMVASRRQIDALVRLLGPSV